MTIIYTNEKYEVAVADKGITINEITYPNCYSVTNIETGIVELYHPVLVVALGSAEHWAHELVNDTYMWVRDVSETDLFEPETETDDEAPTEH